MIPPAPPGPDPIPWGAFLWGGGVLVAVVGVWTLFVWAGSTLWP